MLAINMMPINKISKGIDRTHLSIEFVNTGLHDDEFVNHPACIEAMIKNLKGEVLNDPNNLIHYSRVGLNDICVLKPRQRIWIDLSLSGYRLKSYQKGLHIVYIEYYNPVYAILDRDKAINIVKKHPNIIKKRIVKSKELKVEIMKF